MFSDSWLGIPWGLIHVSSECEYCDQVCLCESIISQNACITTYGALTSFLLWQTHNLKIYFSFCFSATKKCRLKEEPLTFGALCVLKHLLPRFLPFLWFLKMLLWFSYMAWLSSDFIWRLSEAWHNKRPLLVEAVKLLLDEQNLGVRKALSEVLILADSCRVVQYTIIREELKLEILLLRCSWLLLWLRIVTWSVHLVNHL